MAQGQGEVSASGSTGHAKHQPRQDGSSRPRGPRRNLKSRCTPTDNVPPFGWVNFLSLLVVVASIVALSTAWYFGAIYSTTLSTATQQPQSSTSNVFFLNNANVRTKTATTQNTRDYDQLVLPETGTIIQLCRAWTGITLALALIVWALSGLALFRELRFYMLEFKFLRALYTYLFVFVAFAVFFSFLAFLTLLGLIDAMNEDDILFQVFGTGFSCSSNIFECTVFWSSQQTRTTSLITRTENRPDAAWWAMLVASVIGVFLLAYVLLVRKYLTLDFGAELESEEHGSDSELEDGRRRDSKRVN